MTRRAVESTQNAVSLFPFLAVLLCTMGSLILMLIVIARQARSEGENARRGAAKAVVDAKQIDERRDELTWEIDRLAESRKKTAEQLAEQRANLSHIEEHAQRLRSEIAELTSAEKLLEQKTSLDGAARDRLLADVAELRRRAAEIEAKTADAKSKGRRPPAFAIIPFDGENGTRRRPIYIECRDDAILLQPEGIVFSESDFAGSLGPSNPLAECVRVVAEHHARTANLDTAAQPYPLLLVRPGGIGAYYAARAAMSSWDSDFGYELIDADWPLEFPPADPNLTQLLARTQADARRRQAMIARAAPTLRDAEAPTFQMKPHEHGGDGAPGGRYAGGGNGMPGGPGSGGAPGGAMPTGAPASGGGNGGGAPYADIAARDRNRYADLGGANGATNPNGAGLGNGSGGNGLYPNTSTGGNGAGNGLGSTGGIDGGFPGGVPGGPNAAATAGAGGTSVVPGSAVGGNPNGGVPNGGDGPQLFAPGGGGPSGVAGSGNTPGIAAANGLPGPGNGTSGGPFGTPNFEQPPGTGTGTGTGGNGTGPGGTPTTGAEQMGPGGSGVAGGPNGAASGNPGGNGTSAGGAPTGGTWTAASSGANGGGSANGSAGSASSGSASSGTAGATGGGPSASFAGAGTPGAAGGMPSFGASYGGDPSNGAPPGDAPSDVPGRSGRRLDSLARQRGENWGLPDYAKKATALTRPVQVYCSADRLTVFSDRGVPDRQINLGPRTEDSVDELVTTVYSQKESWGIAGRNMYWRPVLSMHVAPDGAARFDELKTLLAGSGLEVTGKPIVMSDASAAPPRR